MTRPIRPALAFTLLMTLVLAGCGIPDNTDVVSVGAGPRKGISAGDNVGRKKSLRTDVSDKAGFVMNFLTSAAGDFDSAPAEMKKFMSPAEAAGFDPQPSLKVIHLVEPPTVNPDDPVVTLRARQVGVLDGQGVLTPTNAAQNNTYQIRVEPLPGQSGLFVTGMTQPALLISDDALHSFYEPRTIYFWNNDHTWLVPDVRYMPQTVPDQQQPTAVLNWLIKGPAAGLNGVVQPLPAETKTVGVIPAVTNNTLQINLSMPSDTAKDPKAIDLLQKQLRWSLRPNLPATMELTVEHGLPPGFYRDDAYEESNPLFVRPSEPQRFAVLDGQIHRLDNQSANAGEPIPVIPAAANHNVQAAAFGGASADRTYAALVVRTSAGGKTKDELLVGDAAPGQTVKTLATYKLRGKVGHPVWAVSPPVGTQDRTVGLIPVGGQLFGFEPDGSSIRPIAGLPGVTAVAAAVDGRRLALISGGHLFMATLSADDGLLTLSQPVAIYTDLNRLTAVDWRDDGTVVVSGVRPDTNHVAVMDVSIDGATQWHAGYGDPGSGFRLGDLGSNPLTYLTTYPSTGTALPMAYQLNNGGYDESSSEKRMTLADLAQPLPNPKTTGQVTAPFFLN